MRALAKQLFELYIQFEIAEKAGQPTIELAQQIADLNKRIAQAKAAPAATPLPWTQVHSHEKAILQPATVNREANGDILWA
jgi:hypothetical protein